MVMALSTRVVPERGTVQNGRANGGPAEDQKDAEADGTKVAFLAMELQERGQSKASVLEVFKKVTDGASLKSLIFHTLSSAD